MLARSRPRGTGSTPSRRSPGPARRQSAAALREVYERAGYRVIGAAPTGRAVRELKEQAGIEESRTLDGVGAEARRRPARAALRELDDRRRARVPAVMIIDEAGMAHTRLSAQVIDAAIAADVKVIAIGDSGQLASVQAGGWLGALTRQARLARAARGDAPARPAANGDGLAQRAPRRARRATCELKTDRRELARVRRRAAGQSTPSARRSSGGRPPARSSGAEQAVLICRDNQRRERLNELARERLTRAAASSARSVEIAGREWACR